MKTKKNMIITSFVVLIPVVVFAALGWGQTSYTVDIKSKKVIVSYLVDPKGKTLYYSKKDSKEKSTCTGECAAMWPEFYTENISVPPGLKASDFSNIKRDDGKKQTTYKGMPLYYFVDDEKPGDTNGIGVYNSWFPATPSVGFW
jgi:predicted lipoprotein with Yx(FWY)xxD motif